MWCNTAFEKFKFVICYLGERNEIDFGGGGGLADFMIPIMFIGGWKKLKITPYNSEFSASESTAAARNGLYFFLSLTINKTKQKIIMN